jgi:hypothetical protein
MRAWTDSITAGGAPWWVIQEPLFVTAGNNKPPVEGTGGEEAGGLPG